MVRLCPIRRASVGCHFDIFLGSFLSWAGTSCKEEWVRTGQKPAGFSVSGAELHSLLSDKQQLQVLCGLKINR